MIFVDCTSSYFSESIHLPETKKQTKQTQTIFEIIERTKCNERNEDDDDDDEKKKRDTRQMNKRRRRRKENEFQ